MNNNDHISRALFITGRSECRQSSALGTSFSGLFEKNLGSEWPSAAEGGWSGGVERLNVKLQSGIGALEECWWMAVTSESTGERRFEGTGLPPAGL